MKYYFFFGGMFSNWFPSYFTVDGILYNCGEQYMMYQKAVLFGDKESAKQIMCERDPAWQKQLGRKVKGFDKAEWDKVKYDIVKKGLREKFFQNPGCKDLLNACKDRIIVEASPTDRIWGIGYYAKDAMKNRANWGENLLGKILTELANE
ncbi:MAG: NADAR family protein [Saprospiraceae bacterium]